MQIIHDDPVEIRRLSLAVYLLTYRFPSLNRAIAPVFGELGACVVRWHL